MLRAASLTNAVITSGTATWTNGTAANPNPNYVGFLTTGTYIGATNNRYCISQGGTAGFAVSSGGVVLPSTSALFWGSTTDPDGALDVRVDRGGPNILELNNGNAAQEFRVYAGNGGFMSLVKTVNESLTIAAAATTASATTIPAGAILLSVAVRVTTVIPTAATFTVTTTTGGTTLNTAAVSTAANSTDAGTAAGASYRAASTTVTITPNATPGAGTGVIRLTYYYIQVTPPTS